MISLIYSLLLFIFVINNNKINCSLQEDINLTINSTVINEIKDNYLSVALDTIVIAEKFKNFNMSNKRLIKMTSYLSPGYLRIGGNLADRLYFVSNANEESIIPKDILKQVTFCDVDYCMKNLSNFTMTGSDWMKLNKFAVDTGFTIIFDLNCLIRNDDGSWNSKNAEELIEFSDKNQFNLHWQLGNEPDSFKHKFNYSVNATQLANDFKVLRTILNKYPRYKKSLLIGPDTTRPRPEHKASSLFLESFLNGTKNIIDIVGWHQYYLDGHTASINNFLDLKTFNVLETQIKKVLEIVNITGFNNTPIWLTETSSAYGGGAKDLSDTFAASFLWIDKLGMAAKYGLKNVVRQSLYHGYYALIDNDYNPSPDWWISYMYKKYVGNNVLSCDLNNSQTTRLYCHCTNNPVQSPLENSAVIIYGSNIDRDFVKVNIKGIQSHSKVVFSYIFTSYKLQAKNILLNGKMMKLSKNGKVPFYSPEIFDFSSGLLMPPYSIVFWVIPSDNLCNKSSHISVLQV